MTINRRSALMIPLAAFWSAQTDNGSAQQRYNFDPVAVAKLRAGEIAREIAASGRDSSVPEPSTDAVFNTGLLLQAGLRALLPVHDREDVALPGKPSPRDPIELVEAQENYKAVFASGAEATPVQKEAALKALGLASQQLTSGGYEALSTAVSDWVLRQRGP